MIDSVFIEGYKSIRSQEVKLHKMNILLGGNGAGKTNFLSVFDFFRKIIQVRGFEYEYPQQASRLLYMGRKVTDKIHLSFKYKDSWINSIEMELKDVDNLLRVRKLAVDDNENIESEAKEREMRSEDMLRILVDQYWIHHFQDTGEKSPYRESSKISDNRVLRADGSNLASFLYALRKKDPSCFRKIEDVICEVAPSFGCFNLMPDNENSEEVRLQWHPKGERAAFNEDVLFDEHQLSDGTLRMISLVTLLLQPQLPGLIIIDEPEIGLHPAAIAVLADLLKGAAERTQIIVSTQSIDLINYFSPEDIIVADYKKAQSQFKRLKSEELSQWLEEYTLGELWEKNVFGGQPY